MSAAENLANVREHISAAARRAGRNPDDITLMAVSKVVEPARIREAYEAGIRVFGENRVQEFAGKRDALRDLRDAEWHLIGHLQSNKAAQAAQLFNAVDSLDSLRLAEKLNAAAQKLGKRLPVLIEINIASEEAKSGLNADSRELEQLLQAASRLEQLEICGLMTIPPWSDESEAARPFFRRLAELRKKIVARNLPGVSMNVLSVGMSHDFEVAIEEGSTCVRVGAAIFGPRPRQ